MTESLVSNKTTEMKTILKARVIILYGYNFYSEYLPVSKPKLISNLHCRMKPKTCITTDSR